MTRQEDIWNCEECNQAYGRHDLWFEGICEKCNAEKNVQLFKVMVSAEGFARSVIKPMADTTYGSKAFARNVMPRRMFSYSR